MENEKLVKSFEFIVDVSPSEKGDLITMLKHQGSIPIQKEQLYFRNPKNGHSLTLAWLLENENKKVIAKEFFKSMHDKFDHISWLPLFLFLFWVRSFSKRNMMKKTEKENTPEAKSNCNTEYGVFPNWLSKKKKIHANIMSFINLLMALLNTWINLFIFIRFGRIKHMKKT